MKHVFYPFLISLTLICSCDKIEESIDKDGPVEQPDSLVHSDSSNWEGKYACMLPSSTQNGKAAWAPGDKILIHGEYSADQALITLAAGDISADGKTCYVSVEGVTPYEQKSTKSTFYLAYPGDMVVNEAHCKDMSTFNGTNALLMAGYNVGEKFELTSLVGGLTFTVTGDFDSYEIRGNNDEAVGYGSLTTRITDKVKSYTHVKGGTLKTIKGNVIADGKTINHICFAGDMTLTDGLRMTLYKGETPVKTYYTDVEYKTLRDAFISLGDISEDLMDYKDPSSNSHISAIPVDNAINLGSVETANCYIVTAPGIYSFKAVKGNTTEGLDMIDSVDVLWETWGTAEEVIPNSVIAQVDYEKDVVYFRVDEDYHAGNAVIAVRNDMGVILWSWHIWIPETPITEGLYNLSRYMTMDRNLGALVAASTDGTSPKAAGLLYQWGRKDPFVSIGDFTTGEPASVNGEQMSLYGGQMTTAKSVKNPTVFADFDGCWNTVSYQDFWDSKKTAYDPCPPGYEVPYRSQNVLFTNSPSDLGDWEFDSDCYMFHAGTPAAVYPLSGWLSWDGSYQYSGMGSGVWTSRASSTVTNGYAFRLYNDGNKTYYSSSSRGKAHGFAVRCVAYDEVPFENAPGTPVKGDYASYSVAVEELSGLCLHTDGSFLWGVGDQGDLVKISFDGEVEEVMWQGLDMEAITIDPETNDLYLGLEANHVYKVAAPDYSKAVSVFSVEEAAEYGNSGVEGISWYKDGMILVGTQTGAYMWAYKLDGTPVWKKSLRALAIGMQEIADIHYDPVKDQIWVIDSVTQCIYLFNGDASEHLATYDVGYGGNCESVYMDRANGCVWMADDDSNATLFKIDFTF